MLLSGEAGTGAGSRSAPLSVAALCWRAALVFGPIMAVSTIAIEPPNWGGRVAVWILGSGIALAAVIRWGWTQCIPVYLADVLLDVLNRRAPVPALLAGLGLPAGVLVSVWLLRRYRFDIGFERSRDMPLFVGAALVGMIIPAAVGAAIYATYYSIDPLDNTPWHVIDFFRWWVNDFVGVLLLGPLLVAVRWKKFEPIIDQPVSGAACLLLLLGLVAVMFFAPHLWSGYELARSPLLLASTVLVVTVCLRFGLVPAATTGLILSVASLACMAFGLGIFRGIGPLRGLFDLWTFLIAMTLPVLLLTWLLAEQRRLERRYEQLFETCPQPLWVHDQTTLRFLLVNAAAERLYGYSRGEFLATTIDVLAHPGDEHSLATILTADVIQPLELRQRTLSGKSIDVEAWARLIDYGGHPAWLVFAFDVSERKALESALVNAVSSEQRRLGQDLHDGLAQDLTVASILASELAVQVEEQKLPPLAEFAQLAERITAAIRSARNIAHGLSPLTSSKGDLASALALLARSSTVGETAVEVKTHLESELRLTLESRTHLYRIAQEAVQNALKHADARRIDIRLEVRRSKVVLEVLDDGRGIQKEDASGSGFGTNTMRHRSSAIGGLLSVRSRPGGGTVVTCSVPQFSQVVASLTR